MTTVEMIEAKPYHCGRMARAVRQEHRDLLEQASLRTHKELREAFDASTMRNAWLLDGKLAALAGMHSSSAISGDGILWVALTDESARHPNLVARHAMRYLRKAMVTKRELGITVLADDRPSIALAYFLGFSAAGRVTVGSADLVVMSYSQRKAA